MCKPGLFGKLCHIWLHYSKHIQTFKTFGSYYLNAIQKHHINYIKSFWKYGDICICTADSLCYKAETNTPKKKKSFWKNLFPEAHKDIKKYSFIHLNKYLLNDCYMPAHARHGGSCSEQQHSLHS